MKEDKKLRELYQKLIDGSGTPEEKEQMVRWLDQLDLSGEIDPQILDEWQQRSLIEFQRAINPPVRRIGGAIKYPWAAVVAVCLLAIVALLVQLGQYRSARKEQQVVTYIEQSTAVGQRKLITLADGSRVWLANSSQIRYPRELRGNERKIYLEGQAFFEVTPDSTRSFIVQTSELHVKVLGTSFEVRHYADDEERAITVASGKVSVMLVDNGRDMADGEAWVLEQGQQVVYHPLDGTWIRQNADLSEELAWRDGQLVLRDKALGEILRQLERWYDVKFEVASGPLKDKRLTMSVKDEPLHKVLTMLSVAGNFRFEITGRQVKIW